MLDINSINESLAPLRKKARNINIIAIVLGVVAIFSMFSTFTSMSSMMPGAGPSPIFSFIVIAILIFILVIFSNHYKKAYAKEVKVILSEKIFEPLFEDYRFIPDSGFDRSLIKSLDILPLGDSFSSNDLLKGRLHNVNFSRADVHTTTTTTDGNGHSSTTTNFRGQVFAFEFFKNSNSYLRIRDRSFSKFGRGRKVDGSKHITFEDSRFNDMFRCYSNNDHEAFYLFTPHFMERLIMFRNKVGNHISLIIHDSMLYLAIYTNTDSFEPSVWRDIDSSFISGAQQDIDIIRTIIDDFDLQNTLFK